jgi:uncharacterized membrane protein
MLIVSTVAIAGWITLNLALPEFERAALDPFPFPLMSAAVSTIGLYLAAMILITQRHDDELAILSGVSKSASRDGWTLS